MRLVGEAALAAASRPWDIPFVTQSPGTGEASRGRSPPLPGTVWLLGIASLLNDASSEAIFPLLGAFLGTLGAPMLFVGFAFGAADAASVAIKVAAGRWSDRLPRKPMVVGGYVTAVVGRAAMALAGNPWQVLGARALDRVGKAVRSGARDALLADAVSSPMRGRAFGWTQALDHVGAAAGPLMASICIARGLSLRGTFAVAAVMGVLAPLLLAARLRDVPARRGAPGARPRPSIGSAPAPGGALAPDTTTVSRRRLGRYVTLCGLFALANSSDAFILIRAAQVGWGPAAIPLLWLGHHAVKSVTTALGGVWADRLPRVWLVVGGWAAYALSYAGLAGASRPWHVAALLIAYAVYHGLAEAPERALVSDLAPPGQRGWAFGWYHGVTGMAALPAGLLTGMLWDRWGAGAAFAAGGALAALAAVALAVGARRGALGDSR